MFWGNIVVCASLGSHLSLVSGLGLALLVGVWFVFHWDSLFTVGIVNQFNGSTFPLQCALAAYKYQ